MTEITPCKSDVTTLTKGINQEIASKEQWVTGPQKE